MGFLRFVVTRIFSYFLALIASISILYLGIFGTIEQAITAECNYKSSTANLACLREFGLNKPVVDRFGIELYRLVSFQFWSSFFIFANGSDNVRTIILAYLPNTILLFTTATVILIILGTLIGLVAARSAGTVWDRLVPIIAVVHSSFPSWWLGFLLIAGLSYGLKILPAYGMTSIPVQTNGILYGLDVADHMILPVLAVLTVSIGGFAYVVRSLIITTMDEDFVLTARARGLSESRIVFRHIFRTASPAIATQAILVTVSSFAGSLLTEIIFLWPGIGLLTYQAVLANDLPVIIGITFVLTLVTYVGLFIGELVYGVLDPRIRVGSD